MKNATPAKRKQLDRQEGQRSHDREERVLTLSFFQLHKVAKEPTQPTTHYGELDPVLCAECPAAASLESLDNFIRKELLSKVTFPEILSPAMNIPGRTNISHTSS